MPSLSIESDVVRRRRPDKEVDTNNATNGACFLLLVTFKVGFLLVFLVHYYTRSDALTKMHALTDVHQFPVETALSSDHLQLAAIPVPADDVAAAFHTQGSLAATEGYRSEDGTSLPSATVLPLVSSAPHSHVLDPTPPQSDNAAPAALVEGVENNAVSGGSGMEARLEADGSEEEAERGERAPDDEAVGGQEAKGEDSLLTPRQTEVEAHSTTDVRVQDDTHTVDDVPVPTTTPGLGIGLLCVILSVTRPNGVDYTTPLTRLLVGTCDRMAVYDGDANQTRSFPWADVVLRGPADVIAARQEEVRTRRRHQSDAMHVRSSWLIKHSLDYAYALGYAHAHRAAFPYALVMEDDIWMEEDFRRRLWEDVIFFRQRPPGPMPELDPTLQSQLSNAPPHPALASLSRQTRGRPAPFSTTHPDLRRNVHVQQRPNSSRPRPRPIDPPVLVPPDARTVPARFTLRQQSKSEWLMWNLHYCGAFELGKVYPHASPFEFKACSQALLYRAGLLRPLVDFIKARVWSDVTPVPIDLRVAEWAGEVQARVLLATPSIVQHLGAQMGASTLSHNNGNYGRTDARIHDDDPRRRDRDRDWDKDRDRGHRLRRPHASPASSPRSSPPAADDLDHAPLLKRGGAVCWADDFPVPAPRPREWDGAHTDTETEEDAAVDPTRRTPVLLQLGEEHPHGVVRP